MKKLMFLYGEIVKGQFKIKADTIVEQFRNENVSFIKVSNDLILQHVRNFSEVRPEGDTYYSRYFSKVLGVLLVTEQPNIDFVEVNSIDRVRVSFEIYKIRHINGDELSDIEIELIISNYEKDFVEILGLNYLEGRIY
jgi:hypothetical protein